MAKKSVRAKRKRTSKRKSSFFQKYLTFPKLALILFIVLLVVWVYEVAQPANKTANGAQAPVVSSK
jgi:hypothetical protein